MCQTKIATFEHYFQLLSNLKIIIIQRRRNIRVFLNFYSRFNHFPARAFAGLSVQSFRLLSRVPPACSPDLLPACSPLSFFRFSRFSANLINTRASRAYRALARGKHIYSNVFVRPSKTTWAFCRSIIKKPRNVVGVFVILISCGQTRQKPSGVTIISPVWTAAVREASTHSTADFVRFATLNNLKTSLLRSSFSI